MGSQKMTNVKDNKQGEMTKKILIVMVFSFSLLLFMTTAALSLDGEAIVAGKCTACHSADKIRNARKSTGDWTVTVDTEINRGAQLDSSERTAVIKYLSANYGTSSEQAAPTQVQPQTAASDPTTPTTQSVPKEQAYTGIEMWQLVLEIGRAHV